VSWSVMDEALAGKTVAGRGIVMRRVHADEAVRCHVLIVPASAMGDWPQVRQQLAGQHVLTVGDAPGFVDQGGMIGFVVEANKLRFEVNQDAAETAGLRLSSRLLSLARSVRRGAEAR
ncbi:MAG TPA: YfiR family protein, partial [Vicinamibacteria bacterium]|nr:YfiR family protein [Vicinamibacteria bacterium]